MDTRQRFSSDEQTPATQAVFGSAVKPSILDKPQMTESPDPVPLEILPRALQTLMAEDTTIQLIDCREPFEHAICQIPGSRLIPMAQIPARFDAGEVPRSARMVIVCHHGVRSLRVAQYLRARGYERAQSLRGGIEAWSCEVDPQVPRY